MRSCGCTIYVSSQFVERAIDTCCATIKSFECKVVRMYDSAMQFGERFSDIDRSATKTCSTLDIPGMIDIYISIYAYI